MKIFLSNCNNACSKFCLVKSVRIWSYSGPYFPAFGLNTNQSEYGKMRTRITPNTNTFFTQCNFFVPLTPDLWC